MVTAHTKPRQTARDLVADHIRSQVLAGDLAPGRKLNVAEFAEELGVSHTPTREALQLLASEGLVRLNAYRGAYVAELSADEYEEISLMRLGLEELAAKLGAERIDDQGIAEARAEYERLRAAADADDIDGFIEADRSFHRIHYLASGRTTLWERIISLRSAAERYTRLGYQLPSVDMQDAARSHQGLLQAIESRNGDLAKALTSADLNRTFQAVYETLVRDSSDAGTG